MNWVYWTLSYEVAFYLVMGILLLAAPAFRVRALAGVHLLICAAACLISSTTQTPWFFVNLWPLFGAGAAVYLLPSDPRTGLLMLGASCFSMTVAPSGDYGLYWLAGSLTCCVCYAVLKGYWHSSETLLSRFGAMSYSLYLIHIPVGVYVGNKIFIEFKGGGLQEILRQGLIFIFTCVAAWGFHLLCEKPFIRPTRNFPRG
jgi:peptidoglycan/LPS O-acetylase OafA/YrhL